MLLKKTTFALKAGFVFIFVFFHTTAWGFDDEEFLKVDIRPYFSVSYGAASVDGCESLNAVGACDQTLSDVKGSFVGAAGIRMNDYLGLEVGYLLGFSIAEEGDVVDKDDQIKIEGGYIAPTFSFPLTEETRVFAKPGAFLGKLTETDGGKFGAIGVFDEEAISFFLDAGVDYRATRNFSFQLGVTWLPDIADTKISTFFENVSDGLSETAEVDVFRVYLGVTLALF